MVDTTSAQACWCTALPTAPKGEIMRDASGKAKTCMCQNCLSALRARRLAAASSAPQT
ncbi:MAG: hypothetical protein K2Y13_02005 [Burkholderiaceae bacterium]|nr:hypothetical protein [Burkholderiaceae bacterium]